MGALTYVPQMFALVCAGAINLAMNLKKILMLLLQCLRLCVAIRIAW